MRHHHDITRQMIIITGGEPELCCGMVRHGMLSGRVGSMHACIYICITCAHPSQRLDFPAYVTSHIQYTTYKIVAMCIECATTLRAIDKLISGSSLEGKTFLRSHQL